MMTPEIRDFEPEDQFVVESLILDGLRDRWGEQFDPSFNVDLRDISANYIDEGATVLVGWLDGQVVATGILTIAGDRAGRLVRMSVSRSHRRQGLGQLLVERLLERARATGLRTIAVSTDTPWTSAVALYRSCGFVEIGTDTTDTHFELRL